MIRAPAFWWRAPGLAAGLLSPLAAVYGALAGRRLGAPGQAVDCPVICIGNPTLGGAGKTPLAIAVARLLRQAGLHPAFLTRGYGGSEVGPLRVEPSRHVAPAVGDEPLLLARVAPTVVARDRLAGARLARAEGADVIVMDDGFQNPALAKDLSILVVDARRGVGNARVFPAGPLRAPLAAQLARAGAIVAMGEGTLPGLDTAASTPPLWRARLVPCPEVVEGLRGRPLLAFAGIGDPEKFFVSLQREGMTLARRAAFADHRVLSPRQASALVAAAEAEGLTLVTTEKDAVRLAGPGAIATLRQRAIAVPVTAVFDDPDAVRARLLRVVRSARA